jgi:hypothetical protein
MAVRDAARRQHDVVGLDLDPAIAHEELTFAFPTHQAFVWHRCRWMMSSTPSAPKAWLNPTVRVPSPGQRIRRIGMPRPSNLVPM